jgi:ribonuclease HI
MLPYIKVNTDCSLRNSNAACRGIFRDQSGDFLGGFSANLSGCSIFEAEVMGFIIAMEMAARHNWRFIWIEGDSTSVLMAFSKPSLVPILWRNRWLSRY